MHHSMRLLELENRDSWLKPYSGFAISDPSWPELEQLIQDKRRNSLSERMTGCKPSPTRIPPLNSDIKS